LKPNGILNQDVCKACFASHGKKWTGTSDFYWRGGYVRCPFRVKGFSVALADIMIDADGDHGSLGFRIDRVPKFCPFVLEQVVSTGEK
jgi:hypothetical protein